MVKIHTQQPPVPHSLMANKKLKGFEKGVIKDCYIQKFSDKKRFAVMAADWKDYFYMICQDENELHETFNEQLTIVE